MVMMMRTITTTRWLMRRFLKPTVLTLTRASFSSSSSSRSSSTSDVVSTTAAADVVGVVVDDDEDDDSSYGGAAGSASSSSVVNPTTPALLQPRVVVYDGVCHLCHRGKWPLVLENPTLNFAFSVWKGVLVFPVFFWLGFGPIGVFVNRGEVGYQSGQVQEDQVLLPAV